MKLDSQGVFRQLVTNLNLKIRISKWRFEYGGSKCKKLLNSDGNRYSGFFRVTDCESDLKIQKYKMTVPIWQTKMKKKLTDVVKTRRFLMVFWVADYESGMVMYEFKMAELIWQTKMRQVPSVQVKLSTQGLFRTLITNRQDKFKQLKWPN